MAGCAVAGFRRVVGGSAAGLKFRRCPTLRQELRFSGGEFRSAGDVALLHPEWIARVAVLYVLFRKHLTRFQTGTTRGLDASARHQFNGAHAH